MSKLALAGMSLTVKSGNPWNDDRAIAIFLFSRCIFIGPLRIVFVSEKSLLMEIWVKLYSYLTLEKDINGCWNVERIVICWKLKICCLPSSIYYIYLQNSLQKVWSCLLGHGWNKAKTWNENKGAFCFLPKGLSFSSSSSERKKWHWSPIPLSPLRTFFWFW